MIYSNSDIDIKLLAVKNSQGAMASFGTPLRA